MKEFFITYWLIGIIYLFVWIIIIALYKHFNKDTYVYGSGSTPPVLLRMFALVLLTLIYPIFTVLLMLSAINSTQKERHTLLLLEELKHKLDSLEED